MGEMQILPETNKNQISGQLNVASSDIIGNLQIEKDQMNQCHFIFCFIFLVDKQLFPIMSQATTPCSALSSRKPRLCFDKMETALSLPLE